MLLKKNSINKYLTFFLLLHVFIWTLIPSVSNVNLPLDTIEALAWGSNLNWGFNKHPPVSALAVEIVYQFFGNQDWAYYFLSQLFVAFSFFIVFTFSKDFFKNKIFSLISVLLLEGIYFYNFTTPEFNVNICQLPFWALTVYYCWEGLKGNKEISWLLLGLFMGLGVLSKYLFIYLLIGIDIFFIYLIIKKKFNFKSLLSFVTFILVLLPHLIWLTENNFTTITYALNRAGIENLNFFTAHFVNPFMFLVKQLLIIFPLLIMLFFIISKFKTRINFKDKKLIFLLTINLVPIILVFLTSLFLGVKIRTMWMTPFYLFIGVLFIYIFQDRVYLKKIKSFFAVFLILFLFSPIAYFYISITQTDKRTDYPGKKISQLVQNKWDKNFKNKITYVGGDEWYGGNLSYHLSSRPIWDDIFEKKNNIQLNSSEEGFILIGNSDILLNICNGIFFKVKKQGICMIGNKK